MDPSDAEVRDVLRRLRATPQHLRRAASGRTDTELGHPPADGGWSLTELLAHLRGAAEVQGRWIERMLAGDGSTIRYSSPRTGMRKVLAAGEEFGASLRAFARQRRDLIETLSPLALADWSRGATFTGTAPGWTPTVFDVVRGVVTHEGSHFEQIAAAGGLRRAGRNDA